MGDQTKSMQQSSTNISNEHIKTHLIRYEKGFRKIQIDSLFFFLKKKLSF